MPDEEEDPNEVLEEEDRRIHEKQDEADADEENSD